jgi:hypothetical protein
VTAPDSIASRLIGSLFVERGLVSESQIRVALEIQRETGEQLGQILVKRFGVSRKELARVVAEQWKDMGRGGGADKSPAENWRPLGEIFVTRGFISEEELDDALKRQRKTGERLGEALVGLGVISKFELAGALAEQMATLADADDNSTDGAENNVVPLPPRAVDGEEMPYGSLTAESPLPEPDESQSGGSADGDVAAAFGVAAPEPALVAEATSDAEDVDAMVAEEVAFEHRPETWPEELALPEPEEPAAVEPAIEPEPEPAIDLEPERAMEHELAIDLEPERTMEHELAIDPEPEPAMEHELAIDPEPEPAFEHDRVVEPEPVMEHEHVVEPDREPAPEPVLEAEKIFASQENCASEPSDGEPAHVGVDPEPHFELQADVTQSMATWHLLVAEPEARPGLCVVYAPSRSGYRLVPLPVVPAVGDTIEVADIGPVLVLRLGASPLPGDTRVCAFVEDAAVPALVAD